MDLSERSRPRSSSSPHTFRSKDRVMKESPDVKLIVPYAAREGMIRSRGGVDGIFLKGIDPSRDIIAPRNYIVEGIFLESDSNRQIVIGRKLATKLDAAVGEN